MLAAVVAIVVVVAASGGDDGGGDEQRQRASRATDDVEASDPGRAGDRPRGRRQGRRLHRQDRPSRGPQPRQRRLEYKTNPPTSGDHFEFPAAGRRLHRAPEIEQLVHALEHGRVVFWYQPDATPQLKGQLKSLFDEDNFHVLLAPNARNMPSEVAASAWTRSITCETVTDKTWDALRLFRDRYRDQAPEQVP